MLRMVGGAWTPGADGGGGRSGEELLAAFVRALLSQPLPRMLNRRVVRRKALLAPHALLRMQDWTHAWRHRQLSNFEYLMLLNTASGARRLLSAGGGLYGTPNVGLAARLVHRNEATNDLAWLFQPPTRPTRTNTHTHTHSLCQLIERCERRWRRPRSRKSGMGCTPRV